MAYGSGQPVKGPLLISWMLWLYSGFFSLGSLAGEVENPKKTFPKLVSVLIPMGADDAVATHVAVPRARACTDVVSLLPAVICFNLLPLVASLATAQRQYGESHYLYDCNTTGLIPSGNPAGLASDVGLTGPLVKGMVKGPGPGCMPRFKAGYWVTQAQAVCWTGPLPASAMGYAFSIGGLLCLVGKTECRSALPCGQLSSTTCHAHSAPQTDLLNYLSKQACTTRP